MSGVASAPFPGLPPQSNSDVTSGDQLAAGVAVNVLKAMIGSGFLIINNEETIQNPVTIKVPSGSFVSIG